MIKRISMAVFALCAILCSNSASAFDLSSLTGALTNGGAESIINSIIAKSDLAVSDLAGAWKYTSPKVEFESEDMLSKAGGVAGATLIENKIAPYYQKAGLQNFTLTINSDGTFKMACKKITLSGDITKNSDGTFQFNFKALKSIKAFSLKAYVKKGTTLSVSFNITKLLELVSKVATLTGSKSNVASTVSTLLKNYKGLYAGFNLKQ